VEFLKTDAESDSRAEIMDETAQARADEVSLPLPSDNTGQVGLGDRAQAHENSLPFPLDRNGQVGQGEGCVPVLTELLRKIPSLAASVPEGIMNLFIRLDDVHKLQLVTDKNL
jgi:hypothetical protein